MGSPEARRAVDAVWRLESARIIAGLARIVRDVGLAEDLAQEALVAALRQWPESGIPPNPGAWLMATAKHRAVDRLRRDERLQRDFLAKLGRQEESRAEFLRAASLTRNAAERAVLLKRAAACLSR